VDASARLVATAAAADLLRRLRDVVGAMIDISMGGIDSD